MQPPLPSPPHLPLHLQKTWFKCADCEQQVDQVPFFIAKIINKCMLVLACGARETCLARCFKISMSGFRSLCVCLMKTFSWLISRNVLKRPQGRRYCAGGTASPCINQQASLRCSSPLRRLRPPVCQIPQHANQAFQVQFRMGRVRFWRCAVQAVDFNLHCFGFILLLSIAYFQYLCHVSKQKMKQISPPLCNCFESPLSDETQITRRFMTK